MLTPRATGCGHLVGGVHPGRDAGGQAHVPRHVDHEPARPHRRGLFVRLRVCAQTARRLDCNAAFSM
jgi:hypothetical protein